jgi:hypothetical protein
MFLNSALGQLSPQHKPESSLEPIITRDLAKHGSDLANKEHLYRSVENLPTGSNNISIDYNNCGESLQLPSIPIN